MVYNTHATTLKKSWMACRRAARDSMAGSMLSSRPARSAHKSAPFVKSSHDQRSLPKEAELAAMVPGWPRSSYRKSGSALESNNAGTWDAYRLRSNLADGTQTCSQPV